jgi:hypothetical protein
MKENNTLWVLGHRISPINVSGDYDMIIGETAPQVPGHPRTSTPAIMNYLWSWKEKWIFS